METYYIIYAERKKMAASLLMKHPLIYYKKKFYNRRYRHGKKINTATVKMIGDVQFPIDSFLSSGHLSKIYYGSYQLEVQETLKKYLKEGDVFFDIGANIGYITAYGANLVGKKGQVHCFEPIKEYYDYISSVIKLNSDYNIHLNNFALGDKKHTAHINIAKPSKMGANSMIDGFIDKSLIQERIEISVNTFDDYVVANKHAAPSFVKIDVEGYEYFVLKGMEKFLEANKKKLPPIFVELTPKIYPEIGITISDIKNYLFSFGYRSYCFMGNHPIDLEKIENQQDILFRQ